MLGKNLALPDFIFFGSLAATSTFLTESFLTSVMGKFDLTVSIGELSKVMVSSTTSEIGVTVN